MSRILIESHPVNNHIPEMDGSPILEIAEFFTDTLQGENYVGYPAAFLRLQHCTLNCNWCDTKEVWRYGNPYTVFELMALMEEEEVIPKLISHQQSLVLTGGSPLKQQWALLFLLQEFHKRYKTIPVIEIENECTIMPLVILVKYITTWNNSPKLSNSGMRSSKRIHPNILRYLSTLSNSWFKFVISSKEDWEEIYKDFIKTKLIKQSQIVLMPEGKTKNELDISRPFVAEMAIEHGVRFTDRLHITIWDQMTGV